MTGTMKTAILALIIISAAMMSGCLTDESRKDATLESMAKIDAIVNDPNYVDNEETRAAILAEMEIIDGKEYELNLESNVTPTPEVEHKTVGVTVRQGDKGVVTGIGEVIVLIQGGKDYNTLKEIEVLVNNISLGTYPAEYQTEYKIECDIIGKWNVRVDGTFTDGAIQTLINTSGFELRELKDAPNAGALGERYIEPSNGMSREDAKKFCEENGIIWGCDDNPISKPTLTSTKVTPTVMPTFPTAKPTIAPTPESTTFPRNYRIEAAIFKTQWDENTVAFIGVNPITRDDEGIRALTYIEISIDNKVIAAFEPNIVKGLCGYIIEECPMIINLPDGITNNGKITAIGTFDWGEMVTFKNGDHAVQVYCQTPPMRYEEEYNQYPVWNP